VRGRSHRFRIMCVFQSGGWRRRTPNAAQMHLVAEVGPTNPPAVPARELME